MTDIDLKLYKEKIISEYKSKYEKKPKPNNFNSLFKTLRILAPISIALGIISSIIFIWLNGWYSFLQLLLRGIIWITIISTFLSSIDRLK